MGMDCKEGEVPEDMQERNFEEYRDVARIAGIQPIIFTLYRRFRKQPPTFIGQRQLVSAAMVEQEDKEESEPVYSIYLPIDRYRDIDLDEVIKPLTFIARGIRKGGLS
jgi:hypothetical protein